LKLVRVIADLEPGGAQLAALRLTSGLARHGVRTTVLAGSATPQGIELCRARGIDVQAWNRESRLQYACSRSFARWLRRGLEEADIVHAHMFGAWWAAARAIPPGVPLVASEHNALRWPGRPRLRQVRDALCRVDLFYAHGPAARRLVLEEGLPPSRLRNGISAIEGLDSRPLEGVPGGTVVFVGRLHPEKGPDVLIEALALMEGRPHAVLVGAGPLERRLRRLVRIHDLERSVTFTGWQDRPGDWIAGAGALTVPSRHEAWSQAAVTAMGLGVPVVGSAVEGLPITLGAGRGVLVEPDRPRALAEALEDVLAGNHTVDIAKAREYALRFSPALVAEAYSSAYRALVTRERRAVAAAA
jgi:glycosyltransferase involved in cell wall biosynthesis